MRKVSNASKFSLVKANFCLHFAGILHVKNTGKTLTRNLGFDHPTLGFPSSIRDCQSSQIEHFQFPDKKSEKNS